MPARTRRTNSDIRFTEDECLFIDRHRVAHLATADPSGAPHVVPVVYARCDDRLYFVIDEKPKRTRTGLKRLRNIRSNPQVALIIDDYDEIWARLAFLLIHGRGDIVDDPDEFARTLVALRARYPQYQAMPLAFATHPMVRIIPHHCHFWRSGTSV
jgi:PPOX class probable F420-dependent enzyme